MMDSTLSMSVRLRRVRTETTTVSVPITQDVMQSNEEGGGMKLDVDKIIEAALQLGKFDSIEWELEGEPEIQLHPIQNATDTNTTIQ
ncbi:hypothetical protein [Occallatibacter savannae]|uniref:hypothetical protein n=1 Tax=Occallatibacter savannae TaxID=1002691 RepID=UPI000D68E265|nr:hypothetical protein [Occallatibacter savannae]